MQRHTSISMGDFRGNRKFAKREARSNYGGEKHFDRDRPQRRSFDKPALEMHTVTCDSCGERCEVPFKPTSGKPVYCSNCFKKEGREGRSDSKRSEYGKSDLERINEKLDKIMEALEIE